MARGKNRGAYCTDCIGYGEYYRIGDEVYLNIEHNEKASWEDEDEPDAEVAAEAPLLLTAGAYRSDDYYSELFDRWTEQDAGAAEFSSLGGYRVS
jgi:hypothetical protein